MSSLGYLFEKNAEEHNLKQNKLISPELRVPSNIKVPWSETLNQETENPCSSSFLWWGLMCIKSRRMKAAGGKKEEDEGGKAAVGSLICSLVDLQCAADLAGPLIACRCNNMGWSSAGVGGSFLHPSPPCPLENSNSAVVRSVCKSFQAAQLVKLLCFFLTRTAAISRRRSLHSGPVLLPLYGFSALLNHRQCPELDLKPQNCKCTIFLGAMALKKHFGI